MNIYETKHNFNKNEHDFIKDEHIAIEKIIRPFYNICDGSFNTIDAFDALERAGYPIESVENNLQMYRISVTVEVEAGEPHEPDDGNIRIHYYYF